VLVDFCGVVRAVPHGGAFGGAIGAEFAGRAVVGKLNDENQATATL
jgi:hypothetical protein